MKYVIELPEYEYDGIVNSTYPNDTLVGALIYALKNGIPLPEHHGRLLILDERLVEQNLVSLNATTSFCNKWLSEVGISNSVVKIIPATEEKSCKNCKYGKAYEHGADITTMDDECGGCCSWNDKWTPKQTATKEGE